LRGDDVANPFVNAPLRIPAQDRALFEKLTTTQQGQGDPDKTPFRRYVDLWWAGVCLGVQEGRRTTPDEWHRFNDGTPLSADPWRILHLQLLAVALSEDGDMSMLDDPGAIIQMANEYAATGLPPLLAEMNRSAEPIMAASAFLHAHCADAGPTDT
jgi:hypothetical protein